MRKKLAILIITILSLGMILVGCKSKTPTEVVNAYFTQLKNEDSEQAGEFIESTISQTDEEASDKTTNESDKVMEEALKLYLSKIDAKVLSEEISGDNATVEVEINGPNISNIMGEVIDESLADAFSGKETDEYYISQIFLEKVESSKSETRSGKVNLIKEGNEWKVKSDDEIVNLILGEYY